MHYLFILNCRHGTRCAGEVAAIGNNSKCVVGLAFNANIGGKLQSLGSHQKQSVSRWGINWESIGWNETVVQMVI